MFGMHWAIIALLVVVALNVRGGIRMRRRMFRMMEDGRLPVPQVPAWSGHWGWGPMTRVAEASDSQLKAELATRDEQIEEMQRRLLDLEERLDFTERLLARRAAEAPVTPTPTPS
jgi:hypothetical protein